MVYTDYKSCMCCKTAYLLLHTFCMCSLGSTLVLLSINAVLMVKKLSE